MEYYQLETQFKNHDFKIINENNERRYDNGEIGEICFSGRSNFMMDI